MGVLGPGSGDTDTLTGIVGADSVLNVGGGIGGATGAEAGGSEGRGFSVSTSSITSRIAERSKPACFGIALAGSGSGSDGGFNVVVVVESEGAVGEVGRWASMRGGRSSSASECLGVDGVVRGVVEGGRETFVGLTSFFLENQPFFCCGSSSRIMTRSPSKSGCCWEVRSSLIDERRRRTSGSSK